MSEVEKREEEERRRRRVVKKGERSMTALSIELDRPTMWWFVLIWSDDRLWSSHQATK